MRRPVPERWSREILQELRATPWAWRSPQEEGQGPPQVIPHVEPLEPVPPPPPRPAAAPMRVQITSAMMQEHGYTAGCRRCTLVRTGRSAAGVKHTEVCRARFEGILRGAGDPRMARADARADEHLAERLRAQAVAPAPGPAAGGAGETRLPVPEAPGATGPMAAQRSGQPDRLDEPMGGGEAPPTPRVDDDAATEVATEASEDMEPMSLDGSMDDVAPELDWLMAELGIDQEPATEIVEEAADLMRALFSAGALPGEVRTFVVEVFSPP